MVPNTQDLTSQNRRDIGSYLDLVEVIVVTLDRDADITQINRKGAEVLGLKREDILGKNWIESFVPERTRQDIRRAFRTIIDEEDTGGLFENVIITHAGEERIVRWKYEMLRDESGQVTGTLSSGEDITEFRKSESALRQTTKSLERRIRQADGLNDILAFDASCPSNEEFLENAARRIREAQPDSEDHGISLEYEGTVYRDGSCRSENCMTVLRIPDKSGNDFILKYYMGLPSDAPRASTLKPDETSFLQAGAERVSRILARRKTERELSQSREFLANVIDSIPDPIFVKDEKHRWVLLNDAASQVMQQPREALLGRSDHDLFPRDQADAFQEKDDLVLNSGRIVVTEERVRWSGGDRTIVITKAPYVDSQTRFRYIVGHIRDITERAESRAILAQSEARFRSLFDSVREGICVVDPDDQIEFCNASFAWILGFDTPQELQGRNLEEFIPDDQQHIVEEQQNIRRQGRESEYEVDLVKRCGVRITVLASIVPRFDAQGCICGTYGVISDITGRKEQQRELETERAHFEQLFSFSPEAVVVVGTDGCVIRCNLAFTNLFGYSSDEIRGRNIDDLISPDELLAEGFSLSKRVALGETIVTETIRRRKDGTRVDVSLLASPIIVGHEQIGQFAIYRDNSEREHAARVINELARFPSDNPDPVLKISGDGRLLYANVASGNLIEHWKRKDGNALPDDIRQAVTDALSNGIRIDREVACGERIYNLRFAPLTAESLVQVYGLDVTEKKYAEKELRLTQYSVSRSLDAAYWFDSTGRLVDANDTACQILGYTKNELHTLNIVDIERNAEREYLVAQWEELRKLRTRSYTTHHVAKDGHQIPVEVVVNYVDFEGEELAFAVARDITERVELLQKERQQAQLLRTIIDNIPFSIFWKDKNLEYLGCNCRFAELTGGISPDGIIGKTDYDLPWNPEVTECYRQCDNQVITSGEPMPDIEEPLLGADGRTSIIWTSKVPLRDHDGDVFGILGIFADITERKRMEDALRASEEKFRTITERISEVILTFDQDHNITYVTPSVTSAFGYRPDEVVGRNSLEFVTDAEHSKVVEILRRISRGEEHIWYETEVRQSDGSIAAIEVSAVPVFQGGRVIGSQAVIRNVSERKLAESTLRLQQTALEAAANAIVITDRQGIIVWCNSAFTDLTGFDVAEARGKSPRLLNSGHHDLSFYQNLWQTILGGQVWRGELVNKRKDGSLYSEEMTITPVKDEEGTITHFVAIKQDITNRKKAEASLRLTQFSIDHASDATFWIKNDSRIVYVNDMASQLLGYTREELLQMTIGDFNRHYSTDVWPAHWEELRNKGSLSFESIVRSKSGREFPVEVSARFLDYEGEEFNVAFLRDITQRKLVENALRESEEKFRRIADTAFDCIWICRLDGTTTYVSPAIERLLGFRPDEIVGKNVMEFVAERDRGHVGTTFEFIAQGKDIASIEHLLLRNDGSEVATEVSAAVVKKDNEIFGAQAIVRDITDRKRSELVTQRFRAIMDQAQESIFVIEAETRVILDANKTAANRLGYSLEELCGLCYVDIEVDCQVLEDLSWMPTGEPQQILTPEAFYETAHRCRNGSNLQMEVTVTYRVFEGKPYALVIARDLTDQRSLEARLRQAQKLESIGSLAAGIAHEINTPIQFVGDNIRFLDDAFGDLSRLSQQLQMAMADTEGKGGISQAMHCSDMKKLTEEIDLAFLMEECPKAIEQSLEGVDRVAKIVRAMKEFSHPSSKEHKLADLNAAIRSTTTVARNEYKYVAELELDLDEALPMVRCQIGDINQVVLNLIVNAAHTIKDVLEDRDSDKGLIRIATRRNKRHAVVTVRDNGAGIPKEIQHRIFDPFFTTKDVGKGTGQGLAIAHSVIVDKHKGSLTFESEVGKGTTFTIKLPLETSSEGVTK